MLTVSACPRLGLLNRFEMHWHGEEMAVPKACQRVVALLGVHNRPLTRDFVAGSLWSEYSDHRAHANLRSALWRLRALDEALVDQSSNVLHLRADVVVDSREMFSLARRLLDPSTACSPEELGPLALDLLGGDLLPEWDDDWVLIEREYLRQLRIHALEALAERLILQNNHRLAVEAAVLAVRAEPLQESAQLVLIRAHFSQGNVSLGLRQFETYSSLLRAELGIDPSVTLRRMVAEARQATLGTGSNLA